MPPAEIRLNREVFNWVHRLPKTIEKAREIIGETSEQQKQALKVLFICSFLQ